MRPASRARTCEREALPAVGMAEAAARGWLVVGDHALDVHRFARVHRGGSQILTLAGGDATFALINAHGVRGQLPGFLHPFTVAHFTGDGLDPADRELRALLQRYRDLGLFAPRAGATATFSLRIALFYIGALVLASTAPWLAAVLLVLGHHDAIWWIHDVAHNAICSTSRGARRTTEFLAILLLGAPAEQFHYRTHRIHHAYTNILGRDGALETGPFVWDRRMAGRSRPRFVRWQALLWFGALLPLIFPLFVISSCLDAARGRRWWVLAGVVARWAIWGWLLGGSPTLLLLAPMIAGYWGTLLSSLNHFHLPITERQSAGFARSVAMHVQNLAVPGRLGTWLTGGLNFHVEHHLFATMPSHRYHEIAADIRALFTRHGLPYRSRGLAGSLVALHAKLRAPFVVAPMTEVTRT